MSMSEELQKRAADKPDKFTIAWWSEQFQEVLRSNNGVKHAMNCVLAFNEDLAKTNKMLQAKIEALEQDAWNDRGKIGELQERLNRQGEFLTELKKNKDKTK